MHFIQIEIVNVNKMASGKQNAFLAQNIYLFHAQCIGIET